MLVSKKPLKALAPSPLLFVAPASPQAVSRALSHAIPGLTCTLTWSAKLPFRELRCSGGRKWTSTWSPTTRCNASHPGLHAQLLANLLGDNDLSL